MIAQDTGSAIVGPARADLYFGAGVDAGKVAGRLRHNMRFVMLVPKSLDPVGARPQAAGAGRAAVGEDRKTVSAGRSARRTQPKDQTETPAARRAQPPCRRKLRPAGAVQSRCRCRRPRPKIEAGSDDAAPPSLPPLSPPSMKRRPSDSIPELPAPPRRKRGLSEEERALWESVAKQVKPLRKRHRVAKPPAVAGGAERNAAPKPPLRQAIAAATDHCPRQSRQPPPLAPIGRRERSQLSRGRKEIDARLDLHGMTQTRAHRALFGFLQRAHHRRADLRARHHRQGQGGRRESERGVLRRQVPQWLSLPEFRSLVVGFEEAHIGHGGEGALYVRVRRASRIVRL